MLPSSFLFKGEIVDELITRLVKERRQLVRDIHHNRLNGWWSYAIENLFGGDSENTKRKKGIERIQALNRQLFEARIVKMLIAGPGERVSLIINPLVSEEREVDIFYISELDNNAENSPTAEQFSSGIRPILLSDRIWNEEGRIWCEGGLFDSLLKGNSRMLPEESRIKATLTFFKENRASYDCIEKILIEILSCRVNPGIFLEKVDLSHVGLTPVKLRNLIVAGIERYGLASLGLSHNRLEASSMSVLAKAVTYGGFRQLKELHLNDNALQGKDCVEALLHIIFTVRLQILNLSENRQLGSAIERETPHPFQRFLSAIPEEMRSLKRLELRGVGFQGEHVSTLVRALGKLLLLEYLDLRDNPELTRGAYHKKMISGLQHNFSLKTLLIDNVEEAFQVKRVLECHQQMFDPLVPFAHQPQPRLVMLLNYIMMGESIPETLLEFLRQETSFENKPFEDIVSAISRERIAVLGMNNEQRIPIHEQEYIAYLDIEAGSLRTFYEEITERVKNRDVEESLLALMQEKKVLALSSQVETDSRKDRSDREQECMNFLQDPNSKRSSPVLFQYPSQAELQESTGSHNVSQMQSDNRKQHAISKV